MIAAISRKMKCAVLEDDRVARFIEYYDAEGNELEGLEGAVCVVAEHPDGLGSFVLQLDEWDELTIH